MHLNDDDYDDDHLTEFINYFNFIHTAKREREKNCLRQRLVMRFRQNVACN
jgi:hypothetical protein